MSQPLVSIIIPCYNAERYIGEAIRSALGQTYRPIEAIVIDDGSRDGSLDVIRSFGNAVRWETGPNRGGCAARNCGVEMARGELIQFLDADDLLNPSKLERQVQELRRSGADFVFCDGEIREGDRIVRQFGRQLNDHDPVQFVLAGVLPTPSGLHYRKNLQAIGGFSENLPCAQERDLHVRLACSGLRFHHLPEVLYTVRRVTGSVSSDSLRVLDQHMAIAWRGYEMLRERGDLTEERAAAFAGFLASDARAYLRVGQRQKAMEYMEAARRMHPDGGLKLAYTPMTRLLRRLLGPVLTEACVGLKRRLA